MVWDILEVWKRRVGIVAHWLFENTKTHCLVGFSLVYSRDGGETEASDVKVMSKTWTHFS